MLPYLLLAAVAIFAISRKKNDVSAPIGPAAPPPITPGPAVGTGGTAPVTPPFAPPSPRRPSPFVTPGAAVSFSGQCSNPTTTTVGGYCVNCGRRHTSYG